MLAIFPLFLLLGLFLPGLFLAKYLRLGLWAPSAFVISLVILFHSIFWLGIFHVPITLWTVLPCLLAATAAAAWAQRKFAVPSESKPALAWTTEDRVLILSSALVGVVLLVHTAISPLMGGDTLFRWDFLAQKLLALGRFDFYPPLTPADFRTYFFVDGIPPMVSFTNWWLYASAGRYLPVLISIFVAAQFAATLAFTYGAAAALFSRRAGVLAAAMLAACPLYFRSVVLGQETGMTALAIAAMLYFIVTARMPDDVSAMASAGAAAALCALSREYGWIAVIAGVIALLWRKHAPKKVLVFAAVATALAAPWYLRNWMLTGNPFYSLRFLGFPVNPIHDRLLHAYSESIGVSGWTLENWAAILSPLLFFATFQVLAGIPGAFLRFRQHGYLAVIAVLLIGVWLQSIGYTSGGVEISTRVLTPALVVLSITGAALLERRAKPVIAAIIVCQLWTAAQGAIYPADPRTLPPGQWLQSAFPHIGANVEFQIRDQLIHALPPGERVLSDSAYLHAALSQAGVEVVPVWSPEVAFIFSSSPDEAERRLRALHIASVVVYPKTLNMSFLTSTSPFYASLPDRWRALAVVGDFLYVLGPRT